jgi:Zn-dependent peptidase ImmA (M78 family)
MSKSLSPDTAAEHIRQIAWSAQAFPVDPVTIARKLGLEVLETSLPDEVSGALIKEIGKDPVIVVHRADSDTRKRFSCAHELGHYVSRSESDDEDNTYEYVDLRGALSTTGSDAEEIFANQFAANLLMPKQLVKQKFQEKNSHLEMAMYFGVSNEAMKFRLKNLGLL